MRLAPSAWPATLRLLPEVVALLLLQLLLVPILTSAGEPATRYSSSRLAPSLSRVKRQTVVGRDDQTVVRTRITCDVADIVFVLDSSGSIGLQNWYKITNFTANVVRAFNVGRDRVRFGVVWYGNRADVAFHLNTFSSESQILNEIARIPWKDQETNTSGALRTMRTEMFSVENGDRPDVPNIGVVITDGESNRDAARTLPEADAAKRDGIILFALGIGNQISMDELEGIANNPKDKYVFLVSDFEALQNIEVQVENAACEAAAECRQDADLVVVLDSSGSVGQANFARATTFIQSLIRDLDIDGGRMRVGAIRYSDGEEAMFYLNTHRRREDLLRAVANIPYTGGRTNTAGALRMLREQLFRRERGDRREARNVGVLFSDGGSANLQQTLKMAAEARAAGVELLVVAVGDWVKWEEVNGVASFPHDRNVFHADDYASLGDIQVSLRQAICNDRNWCAPNPCRNGGQCTASIGHFVCTCPSGYAGKTCHIRCESPVDFVLALDSSSSIGAESYGHVLQLVRQVALSLPLGPSNARLGLITYGTTPIIRFQMNRYRNQQEAANAISFPYQTGDTNTAGGLRQIREEMYVERNGDRNHVRNVAVLVTDGHSSDRKATWREAREFQTRVGPLVVVSAGQPSKHDMVELRSLASGQRDTNVLLATTWSEIVNFTDPIVRTVCNAENECASNPCKRGGRCVDGINMFTCECQQGSTGTLCERGADGALDVGILIDVSGSIRRERFPIVMDFVKQLVEQLEIGPARTRVGVATFADDARAEFYLDTYDRKEDVLQALEYVYFREGRTNTAAGLRLMRRQLFSTARGDRENAPNIAVVITDGNSNMDSANTLTEAARTKDAGIYVVVGTTEGAQDKLEVRGLASEPVEQNVVSVRNYDQMGDMLRPLVAAFTNEDNECDSNPCRNGGTCLDGIGMFSCRCRSGYAGIMCERRCSRRKDVAFVFDASGSTGQTLEWQQFLAKSLVRRLNVGRGPGGAAGDVLIAAVKYQADKELLFQLNTYDQWDSILNALTFGRDSRVTGTDTSRALEALTGQVFVASRGDRRGADNVAIVMSDGRSNINRNRVDRAADDAKRVGIRLISVGFGDEINDEEMRAISSEPKDRNTYRVTQKSQVEALAERLMEQLCV